MKGILELQRKRPSVSSLVMHPLAEVIRRDAAGDVLWGIVRVFGGDGGEKGQGLVIRRGTGGHRVGHVAKKASVLGR